MSELLKNSLSELTQSAITQIDSNFWFIRTDQGSLYDDFIHNDFVAIGYNSISMAESNAILNQEDWKESLTSLCRQKDFEVPGLAASQIQKFEREIKDGDYVVIPSQSSKNVSIGIFYDDMFDGRTLSRKEKHVDKECDFHRARRVNWIKKIPRYLLDPKLWGLFSTRQTIVNANGYSTLLLKHLYNLFKYDGSVYFVIPVTIEDDIPASTFYSTSSYLELADLVKEIISADSEFFIKFQVASKGDILLIEKEFRNISILLGVAILLSCKSGINSDSHRNRWIQPQTHDSFFQTMQTITTELERNNDVKDSIEKVIKSIKETNPPKR